jgi:hypothetical protein
VSDALRGRDRPAISKWRMTEFDVDVIVKVARELGESLAVTR